MLLTLLLIVLGIALLAYNSLPGLSRDVRHMIFTVWFIVLIAIIVYLAIWVGKYAPW